MTAPAKAALEREKRFVADASHELKTPLGAIGINAQALEQDEKNEFYINNILSETRRMNRLIERLLTLSKIEEGSRTIWEIFSLSQAVEEIVLTYESVVYEKKIDFEYEIMDGILIKGDVDEWKQVVAILLDNAIKNTGTDGRITARLRRDVTVGTHELFYPDIIKLYDMLDPSGSNELIIGEEMIHVYPLVPMPEAKEWQSVFTTHCVYCMFNEALAQCEGIRCRNCRRTARLMPLH